MLQSRYSAVCAQALGACVVLLVLLHACREADRPTAPLIEARNVSGINGSKVALFYVCDNKFRATNANPSAVTTTYTVVNTAEQGTLNLPPKPKGAGPSETVFATQNTGTVQLYLGTTLLTQTTNDGVSCSLPPEAQVGQWSSVLPARFCISDSNPSADPRLCVAA